MQNVMTTTCSVPLLCNVAACYIVTTLTPQGSMTRSRFLMSGVVHLCGKTHFLVVPSSLVRDANSLTLYREIFRLVENGHSPSAPFLVLRAAALPPPAVDERVAGCFATVDRFLKLHPDFGVFSLGSFARMRRVGATDIYRMCGSICMSHALVFSPMGVRLLDLPRSLPCTIEEALDSVPVYSHHVGLIGRSLDSRSPVHPHVRPILTSRRGWSAAYLACRHPECVALAVAHLLVTAIILVCLLLVHCRRHAWM